MEPGRALRQRGRRDLSGSRVQKREVRVPNTNFIRLVKGFVVRPFLLGLDHRDLFPDPIPSEAPALLRAAPGEKWEPQLHCPSCAGGKRKISQNLRAIQASGATWR